MEHNEKLKEMLDQHNISAIKMAQTIGISRQAIDKVISGKNEIRFCNAKKMSEVLGLSLDEFAIELGLISFIKPFNKWMDGRDLLSMTMAAGYRGREFTRAIGVSTAGMNASFKNGTARISISKAVLIAEKLKVNLEQLYDQTAQGIDDKNKLMEDLVAETGIDLRKAPVFEFAEFLKRFTEITYTGKKCTKSNIWNNYNFLCGKFEKESDQPCWINYPNVLYSNIILGADPENELNRIHMLSFSNLIKSLGKAGAKSLDEIMDIKPEDYNAENSTIYCGGKYLNVTNQAAKYLKINQLTDELNVWAATYKMESYRGSLIKFPIDIKSGKNGNDIEKTILKAVTGKIYMDCMKNGINFEKLNESGKDDQ